MASRIPKAELTGIYGAMVKRMTRKMIGDVPDAVSVVQPEGAELQLQPRS